MRVAGERDRRTGFETHLEERSRRVELADALAQPGRRDLDGDARLGDAFDRQLVVAAQVAAGQRALLAPDLDEVWVREDVEQAAARSLADRLEVALPDLLDAAPGVPHAVVIHVDGAVADAVHRADDVVEVTRLQQVRD